MEIHARLKLLRILCGMTQEELAFQVKMPRASLGHYERGSYIPRDRNLEILATIFGVEPGYIRYGLPVVESQAWLPVLPANARRKRETINDILKHLPDFIVENRFDSVIYQILEDGCNLFFFGRKNHFTCLLVATVNLAISVKNVIQSEVPITEMSKAKNLTIQSYSAQDLDFYATHENSIGKTFDKKGIFNSLSARREELKKFEKDPLKDIFISLLKISNEYDFPPEAIYDLSDYLDNKYNKIAPLKTKRIHPNDLMNDIRVKVEELGGELREQN